MYLRFSTVRRGDRTYRYAQLVECFRRPDGTPTNRVLAHLGALDDTAVENLRVALAASRAGKAVVLPLPDRQAPAQVKVLANLRYLDLVALLKVWRDVGLDKLVRDAVPTGEATVPIEQILTALVLQRCVAPASKLAAERWYPTTALPELQGISPEQFNNSRVHRALSALDAGETSLQDQLPLLLGSKEGEVTALFIDATDTWFVGQGPPLAQKGLDKEGLYRRRVGLVLLCDQRGYPFRWHTLDGRYHDPTALAEMAAEAAKLPWTKGVPVVMDRAAGNAAAIEGLDASGLHYVTAVPSPEFESCQAPIPWEALDALQAESSVGDIVTRITEAGFVDAGKNRYVRDLGLFDKARTADTARPSLALASLRLLEEIERESSLPVMAKRSDTPLRTLQRYAGLRGLSSVLRERIRSGDADGLDLKQLRGLAVAPPDAQSRLLDTLVADQPARRRRAHGKHAGEPLTLRARGVLSFSPQRFLDDRRVDEEHVAHVMACVEGINQRLAHPSNRRTDASALAEVEKDLKKFGLRGVFEPEMVKDDQGRRVSLRKDAAAWARRRRADGLNLVVAHPAVRGDGPAIVSQYFAKDAIEKDFQTIKSFVELRPIHHRTDAKVRAHVTICVLALLLHRLLGTRTRSTSPRAALELLKSVHLNLIENGDATYYTVTRPNAEVTALLRRLSMADLVDDATTRAEITPR